MPGRAIHCLERQAGCQAVLQLFQYTRVYRIRATAEAMVLNFLA